MHVWGEHFLSAAFDVDLVQDGYSFNVLREKKPLLVCRLRPPYSPLTFELSPIRRTRSPKR